MRNHLFSCGPCNNGTLWGKVGCKQAVVKGHGACSGAGVLMTHAGCRACLCLTQRDIMQSPGTRECSLLRCEDTHGCREWMKQNVHLEEHNRTREQNRNKEH